jgi:hypothetical protein
MTKEGQPIGSFIGEDITKYPSQFEAMIRGCVVPATTIMARRECFESVGLLNEALVYSEWEILVRMLSCYRAGFINRPLARYRIHDRNTSTGSGVTPEKIREDARAALFAIEETVSRLPGSPERLSGVITQAFKDIERRYARSHIDRFVAGAAQNRYDFGSLVAAWKASPRDIYCSRKSHVIAKMLLLRLLPAVFRNQRGKSHASKTQWQKSGGA